MAQYPMNYPYMNPYGGYQQPVIQQPYQPMDRLAQLQNQYQLPQYNQNQQTFGLEGEVVDSIDVVKAKNVNMNGNIVYYPQADQSTIFTKQLQPDGTSRILTYRISQDMPKEPLQQPMSQDVLNEMFGQLRQDVLSEINGIKDLVGTFVSLSTDPQKRERGGGQK